MTAGRLLMCGLLLWSMSGCDSGGNTDYTPTPRRRAYPRPHLMNHLYSAPTSLPLKVEINTQADTMSEWKSDGSVWLTVGYPSYHSQVYWTITPVTGDDIREVIDNRTERMRLNLGDLRAEMGRLNSEGGFECLVMKAIEPTSTPLQFVAADGKNWVVSGTVWMSTPGTSADSLQPYLDALSKDILHALSHLSARK